MLKPFVLLDPFDMEQALFRGIVLHSHSGIATVTYLYLFQGSVRYEDDRSDWRLGRRRR
jgi:redox-sensitive bicupin YhaK (pirin superfamily)